MHEVAGRIAYNAKGPSGIALISDAMPPAASGPSVYELQGRRVNQVGLKLTLEDGTLAGAAITMLDAVRYSVSTLGIDVAAALEMATLTPARLLRIDDSHGRLRAGARADLVHLSDDLDLEGVWIGGNKSTVFGGRTSLLESVRTPRIRYYARNQPASSRRKGEASARRMAACKFHLVRRLARDGGNGEFGGAQFIQPNPCCLVGERLLDDVDNLRGGLRGRQPGRSILEMQFRFESVVPTCGRQVI